MSGPYPRRRARKNATVEERLRLHMIEAPSGCWIWTGARSGFGHGRFQLDGRTAYAHRVSYETFVGPIPAGMQIDHLCRRPACIKPLHLQVVTPSVNVRRGTSPGARAQRRDACSHGHPYAEFGIVIAGRRVCQECARIAKRRYNAGPRNLELAAELRAWRRSLGVSQAAVGELLGITGSRICGIERCHDLISPRTERRLRSLYERLEQLSEAAA